MTIVHDPDSAQQHIGDDAPVLVGIDGSPAAAAATALAFDEASRRGVPVQRRLVCDVPARWLIDESKSAQLVIVGSRGRGGIWARSVTRSRAPRAFR